MAEAGGCIEFWLNRYQSGIGGLLALAGAFIAGAMALAAARIAATPVLMQLKESERQTALLALPVLQGMTAEEVFEESVRKFVENDLVALRKVFAAFGEGDYRAIEDAPKIRNIKTQVESNLNSYAAHIRKTPRGQSADAVREKIPHLGRVIVTLLDEIAMSGDAHRMGMARANLQADVTRFCVRFASYNTSLTEALFAAHTAGEERRAKLAVQIGKATEVSLG